MASIQDDQLDLRASANLSRWPEVLAAGATFLCGFALLGVLGSIRSWAAGVPGFWSFPSGTLGDGLLLPTLVAGLLATVRRLGAAAGDRWARLAGGVAGMTGGVVVQLSWYVDDHPTPGWMLPRAHHFTAPGWIHAVFLVLCSGAIGALSLVLVARLRARNAGAAAPALRSPAFVLAYCAGIGMIVLIGRDSVQPGTGIADLTTLAMLCVVGLAFTAVLSWAVGWRAAREQWRTGVLGLVTAAALVGLVQRWPPHDGALVAVGTLVAALTLPALVSVLGGQHEISYLRAPTAAVGALVLVGGMSAASDAAARGAARPMAWVVGAVLLAWGLPWLLARRRVPGARATGTLFFTFYCFLVLFLAIRLRTGHDGASEAGAAVGVADAAFDVMVFALVRDRFGQLDADQELEHEQEYLVAPEERPDTPAVVGPVPAASTDSGKVLLELVLLAVAVGLALLTLMAMAAAPLGLDAATPKGRWSGVELLGVGVTVIATALLIAARVTATVERRLRRPSPKVQRRVFPLVGLAAMVWGAIALALPGAEHRGVIASVGGVALGLLAAESIIQTPCRVRLQRTSPAIAVTALLCGIATALSASWLIACGLSQSTAAAATSVFLVFLGNFLLHVMAGRLVGWTLSPERRQTEHELDRVTALAHVLQDAANATMLALVALAIPLYAVGRDTALHRGSLSVVSSMVFLPGLVAAMLWGRENNIRYINWLRTHPGVPRALVTRCGHDWDTAERLERRRRARIIHHVQWQTFAMDFLLVLGLGDLAYVLLR